MLFVPANEIEIYEKISIQFVSFLKSDHDYLSLLDLAEIIALFKQSKLISTTVIQQNLALISVYLLFFIKISHLFKISLKYILSNLQ